MVLPLAEAGDLGSRESLPYHWPAVQLPITRAGRALLAAPLAAALIAGCGGGEQTAASGSEASDAAEFPAPDGRTLEQMAREEEQSDLVVVPSQSVFDKGESRYGFGVFTVGGDNVPDAKIALYAAAPDQPAIGPFPASSASLATEPAFRSQTTAGDPDAATYVYTADVELPTDGEWQVLAMVRDDSGGLAASVVPNGATVGKPNDIPDVGDRAPVIHTPTANDVGGVLNKIDTRVPASTMHDVDFADVVGTEPVVLLFATPALCTSRVCGPVVDIAEQVKSERPDDAAFIHMEIYEDNDPNKGPRRQVLDYGLMSEPWLFVIGADGKVSTRIEGAFSAAELNAALDKVG